jgi:RNA polymerase sigma-70 factor (ECF subfamily)
MPAGELQQALRERLLLATKERAPRIASYSGSGPLGGWIRVAAVRVLSDLRRGEVQHVALDADRLGVASPAPDPEHAVLKADQRQLFRDAFESAIAQLDATERNFLALHYVDQMSTDAIGALYRLDGSTVRRRIARSREAVVRRTRAQLRDALQLTPGEIDGVLAIVESQVDLSLTRLLKKS